MKYSFKDLGLSDKACLNLTALGYIDPTPVQIKTIPVLLEGRDVLASAQTGTGKTAAFALPLIEHLSARTKDHKGKPQILGLILAPTRELACQVHQSFRDYSKHTQLRSTVIHGGVAYGPQIRDLNRGVDVLVATPGRLLDLMSDNRLSLTQVEYFVLDEADRMLDLGFKRDIDEIRSVLPDQRQSVLFSATVSKNIRHLAEKSLSQPVTISLASELATADNIDEQVMFVKSADKLNLLLELLADESAKRTIVFTRTKRGAEKVSRSLNVANLSSDSIHGNKSQSARLRTLKSFRRGKIKVLVATDVAARGLDIDGVTHVVNFELSHEPESYLHRIGRTARAGQAGTAVTLCDELEIPNFRTVERLMKREILTNSSSSYHCVDIERSRNDRASRPKRKRDFRPKQNRSSRGRSAPRRAH